MIVQMMSRRVQEKIPQIKAFEVLLAQTASMTVTIPQ